MSTSPNQTAIISSPPHQQQRLQHHHQKTQSQPVRHLTGTITTRRANLELANVIHAVTATEEDEESVNHHDHRHHDTTPDVIDEDFYF